MAARLGEVLYWAATMIAALALVLAVYATVAGRGADRFFPIGVIVAFGVLGWLLGRACRYVLAGR
jgi:hypothetical protein